MVEGEHQVCMLKRLAAVHSYSEELGVVDFAIVVEVNIFKDLLKLSLGNLQLKHR